MMDYLSIEPLSWLGLGVSALAGAIVGCERQVAGKPVGIRTSALICLGTYLFVRLGAVTQGGSVDPTRVLGQVVTGIGFIGAGVMMSRDGVILGVTSAASIWTLAGIGAAAGLGHYRVAFIVPFVVVGILLGIGLLEDSFRGLRRGVHTNRER